MFAGDFRMSIPDQNSGPQFEARLAARCERAFAETFGKIGLLDRPGGKEALQEGAP